MHERDRPGSKLRHNSPFTHIAVTPVFSFAEKNHAAMQVTTLAGGIESEIGSDEAVGAGELAFAALHLPACRAGNGAWFETGREVAMTRRGKPQNVAGVFSECNLTSLLKFVGTGKTKLRIEEGKLALRRGEIGLDPGAGNHGAEDATGCAAGGSQGFGAAGREGSLPPDLHRVEKFAHVDDPPYTNWSITWSV
jgi:hypothetical protein